MNPVRAYAEVASYWAMFSMARLLPTRAIHAVGRATGSLMYRIDGRHRAVAMDNLHQAFGDGLSQDEARRITRACWRHFGRVSLDMLALHRYSQGSIGRLVDIEGSHHVREAYARGKGVLFFSGHLGHWELIALMHGYHFQGLPLSIVARPLDNPHLERLLARMRGRSGNTLIYKRNAAREMMRALRDGHGVALLIDQDARDEGVFVPFFGRLASTTPSLALLALRSGAAVIPMSCIPEGGRYRIRYEQPVTIEKSGERKEDVLRLTARCTSILEGWVRQHPMLWLWMHRRWKTRPDETASAETS